MNFLAAYFFLLPFTSAFNVSPVLTLPVISLVFLSAYQFSKPFITKSYVLAVSSYQLFIFAILLCGTLSVCFSVFIKYSFVYTHTISLLFVFFAFVMIPLIGLKGHSIDKMLKPLHFSFYVVCCFCFFEFLTLNFTTIDIVNKIPRPDVADYSPLFFQVLFRARSTFEESGHFASFITVVFPFLYIYTKRKKELLIVFLSSLAMSASVGGIIVFILLIIPFIIFLQKAKVKFFILTSLALFMVVFSPIIISKLIDIYNFKIASGSLTGRFESYFDSIDLFFSGSIYNLLFGFGPGSYQYLLIEPAINAYINLLRDIGLIGLLLFFLFVNFPAFYIMFRYFTGASIEKLSGYGWAVFFATLAVNFWLLSIPNYFYPHFYIPLIFFLGFGKKIYMEKSSNDLVL